mmetsp:Transcript_5267/g.13241  ORF Transcript_5267/g.13241 Transcript_5267/m.13241 type:complete len:300 (-) Transcript_5267:25-924(-)
MVSSGVARQCSDPDRLLGGARSSVDLRRLAGLLRSVVTVDAGSLGTATCTAAPATSVSAGDFSRTRADRVSSAEAFSRSRALTLTPVAPRDLTPGFAGIWTCFGFPAVPPTLMAPGDVTPVVRAPSTETSPRSRAVFMLDRASCMAALIFPPSTGKFSRSCMDSAGSDARVTPLAANAAAYSPHPRHCSHLATCSSPASARPPSPQLQMPVPAVAPLSAAPDAAASPTFPPPPRTPLQSGLLPRRDSLCVCWNLAAAKALDATTEAEGLSGGRNSNAPGPDPPPILSMNGSDISAPAAE